MGRKKIIVEKSSVLSIEQLRTAAKEVVEVQGLVDEEKNKIEITDYAQEEELRELLRKGIEWINPEIDKFSDETMEIIEIFSNEENDKSSPITELLDDDEPLHIFEDE